MDVLCTSCRGWTTEQTCLPGARSRLCDFYPYRVFADTYKKQLAFLIFLFKHRFQPFKPLVIVVNPVFHRVVYQFDTGRAQIHFGR